MPITIRRLIIASLSMSFQPVSPRRLRLLAAILGLGALLGGCATASNEVHPVVSMAAFDLNCPRAKLRYTQINDDTWGVDGCGQRAKYIRACRQVRDPLLGWNDRCQWVRN